MMRGRKYDLHRLRHVVAITDVLGHYGLHAGLRAEGAERVGPCPLPDHAGDRDNRTAFRVHPDRGLWHCQTHCAGGDLVDFAARMEGGDYAAAARVLVHVEDRRPPATPHTTPVGPSPNGGRPFTPYTRRLRLDPEHPLLRARGIQPHTARTFEAGGWPLAGFLEGCVGIRLHDLHGRPLGYAGRRLDDEAAHRLGKWKLPVGLPRAGLLFNWHRARPQHESTIVIVEGPFDAMRVWQAGHRCVVALLGSSPTQAQADLLARATTRVLMLDGDPGGRDGARRLASLLPNRHIHIIDLPDGTDPADLPTPALRSILLSLFS